MLKKFARPCAGPGPLSMLKELLRAWRRAAGGRRPPTRKARRACRRRFPKGFALREAASFKGDCRMPVNDASLPGLAVTPKTGQERFLGAPDMPKLLDFWAWAYSDLAGNTQRGKLAEYIVALAVGCQHEIRPAWESYDLLSPAGIKIEVKSSAYIQSWEQEVLSDIRFDITEKSNQHGSAVAGAKKRQADVYVFCVLKHKDWATLNPLDLSQWEFYPVATRRLNACFKQQKSLGLSPLRVRCRVNACGYEMLKTAIEKVYAA